jgi:nitrate/TMAO reductase-like tetraheme cytochrome c subunit
VTANTSKQNRQLLFLETNGYQHQNNEKGVQAHAALLWLPLPIWPYYASKPLTSKQDFWKYPCEIGK